MRRVGVWVGVVAMALGAGAALAGPNSGKLRFIQQLTEGQGVSGISGATDVAVSPDGKSVYVTGWDSYAVAMFRRGADGTLKFQGAKVEGQNVDGMRTPGDVEIAPDGRFVYVTSELDEAVVVFRRNKRGRLRFSSRRASSELAAAYGLGLSPDGRHLYVTTQSVSSRLVVLERNRRSGKLRMKATYEGGDPQLDTLHHAASPVVSPDGKTVYVPAGGDSALVVMKRNKRSGRLKQIDIETDGVNGVDGLAGTYGVTVSRDGRNVYASGTDEGAIATFKRNRKSGRLKFVNAKFNGAGAGDGLDEPYDVLVSRDGKDVYVAGFTSDAITAFKRNLRSGKLRFKQTRVGTDAFDFGGPWRMAAGPGTRELYVVGYDGNTVVALKRRK